MLEVDCSMALNRLSDVSAFSKAKFEESVVLDSWEESSMLGPRPAELNLFRAVAQSPPGCEALVQGQVLRGKSLLGCEGLALGDVRGGQFRVAVTAQC